MSQLELLISLTLRMEIDPANPSLHLIESRVVEALERRSRNTPYPMIRHQEVLLPPHIHVLLLPPLAPIQRVLEIDIPFRLLRQGAPGGEACPMDKIGLVGRAPGGCPCAEGVFVCGTTDNLTAEEGR